MQTSEIVRNKTYTAIQTLNDGNRHLPHPKWRLARNRIKRCVFDLGPAEDSRRHY